MRVQGLGKTLQSIALLASLKETGRARGPHLIIVPLSVLSQWMGEIAKWCPSLKALRYHGTKQERGALKRSVADLVRISHTLFKFQIHISVHLSLYVLCMVPFAHLSLLNDFLPLRFDELATGQG